MDRQVRLNALQYSGDIAYRKSEGQGAGIIFLYGYASDMDGTKSAFVHEWAIDNNRAFLRFDMRGHGLSKGDFDDFTLQDWLDDALHMLDQHTKGPQIIVGSSMGGWLALHLAQLRPARIKHMIGIAAAPDFVRKIPDNGFKIDKGYQIESGLTFTQKLLDEGEALCLLDAPIEIDCPITLLQGKRDESVPWQTAERIKARLKPDQCKIIYVEDADHRFSSAQDLEILKKAVEAAFIVT